uniref:Variable lymphocyte receptor B cassette n=1 Tax=Petromyzon marinus TaxID=7757 RepID=S4RK80_PETMA
ASPSQCSCGKFSWSGELQTTDCDGKGLSSVPSGIPDNTQNLDLRKNQIDRLPEGVFNPVSNQAHLAANEMTALPARVFNKLTQLTRLDLERNEMTTVP